MSELKLPDSYGREQFAARLLKAIKVKGMTQKEISCLLDVTEAAVSQWCNGVCFPSVENTVIMAMLLGVTLDYLVIGRRTCYGNE